jgi:AcrR family transcriptional regulator
MSKSSSEAPLRRRDEARALFRNAILDAAEAVFAEHGFHGARIQDVAERARVGVGTVYNHFAQKEDILRALIDERTEELLGELRPQPSDRPDFAGRLAARIARLLAYVDGHRGFLALVMSFGVAGDPSADEGARTVAGKSMKRIERFRAALRTIIEEGIAEGALEPGDATQPTLLAVFLSGAIRAFTVDATLDPSGEVPPAAERARLIVRLFLRGAGKR